MTAVGRGPRAPLHAVYRAQVAVGVGPFVPDRDAALLQPADVGIAPQKPEQFYENALGMQFFGGDQRKALVQIETHLVAEHRTRSGAGAVGLAGAMFVYMAHEVFVLLHDDRSETGFSGWDGRLALPRA